MPHIKSEKIKYIDQYNTCEHTIQADYSTVSDIVEITRSHTDGRCGLSGNQLDGYSET